MPSHRADKRAPRPRATPDLVDPARRDDPGGRHRADARPARRSRVPAPLHRASHHAGRGARRVSQVLSAPTMVGTAALVLATAGTMTVSAAGGTAAPLPQQHLSAPAVISGTLQGTSAVSSSVSSSRLLADALSGRDRAVSRDSQRQALADAADKRLQAAAEQQARERNAALAQLAASAQKQADLIAKDAWQLPLSSYRMSARFGQCSALWSACHTGQDLAAPSGTPIKAVANGVVTETEYAGSYGNRTIMTLEDGTEIWYCHQTSFSVQPGQRVVAGQTIGLVGSTGNSTGPHLHIEIRPGGGDPVDPLQAFAAHGLTV